MIDRPVVELTLLGHQAQHVDFHHVNGHGDKQRTGTPSSEHSVVIGVEGKTTLCLKQPFVDKHTELFFSNYSAASVFNSF